MKNCSSVFHSGEARYRLHTQNRQALVLTFACCVFLATAITTLAAGALGRQVVPGHVPAAIKGLQPEGALPATNRMRIAIGLPLRNQKEMSAMLQRITDPGSPDFHHYLTPEQFAERFGPSEQDYQAVIDFAKSSGLTVAGTHPNRTLLEVDGTVGDIEKAIHVKLYRYRHPKENRDFYAPDSEPSLNLGIPILHIAGLDNYILPYPKIRKKLQINEVTNAIPKAGSGPIGSYMGYDFRKAYVPETQLTGAGQSVALVEFDGYYSNDIASYITGAGLPNVALSNVLVGGFSGTPGINNTEVALDIDMAIAMAPGLSKVLVYEAGFASGIPTILLNRIATDNLAKQIGCSWGWNPFDPTIDQIFQQYALQGQTFFNASGDDGADFPPILPPSDNPYITQVGGTTLTTGPQGEYASETVWNWGSGTASSGGVSGSYSIPEWQQGIDMSANQGSTTMRNFPDVALTADNIYIFADDGRQYLVGGTSAAAPLWAGYLALVNERAKNLNFPEVGFINSAVYSIAKGSKYTANFHDITTGDNRTPSSPANYFAVSGYDLCTGWGTPTTTLIDTLVFGGASRSGLLQTTIDPPSGSSIIASSNQPIFVTVTDVFGVTNATVTATIPGVTNLSFLNDGTPPDSKTGDDTYSASFQPPSSPAVLNLTVSATATNEFGITNNYSYTVIPLPANDNFANAIKVPVAGTNYLSNNRYATIETNELTHAGVADRVASLWWSWTPSSSTSVLIDTTGSAIDTVLAVYTGSSLTTLTTIAATNNVGTSKQAYVSFNAIAGVAYRIVVAGATTNSLGSIRLAIRPGGQYDTTLPSLLVNSPLSGLWVSNNVVTLAGTANDPQPNASGVRQVNVSVNGQWVFAGNGTTTWTCQTALKAGLNNLKVTAVDYAGNVSSPVNLQLTYVVVGAPNDLFTNAISLTATPEVASGFNTNATKEFGEPAHAGNLGGKSVWWRFQPPADGLLSLNTTNSTFDTLLAMYTGTSVSSLTTIASNDDAYEGAPGGFSAISQAVKSNVTYYIAVDGYGAAYGAIKLNYSFAPSALYHVQTAAGSGGTVQVASANNSGGMDVMAGNSGDFASGSIIVLTAIPDSFYSFSGWSGSVVSGVNPLSIVVTNDLNLTAQFQPVAFTDGFESGDLSHLNWTTGGNAPWTVQTSVVATGTFAARSGIIGNNKTSSLILTTNFAGGDASFDYRVSCETNFDALSFYLDGVTVRRWSGEVGWATFTFTVPSGLHTLEWRYAKDNTTTAGMDAAFVDDINLPLGIPIDASTPAKLQIGKQPDGSYVLNVSGQTNQTYITQVSSNLVNWQNISTNTAVNGAIQISIPVGNDAAAFYRAIAAPQ